MQDNNGWTVDCRADSDVVEVHFAGNEFTFPENADKFRAVSLCTPVIWWIEAIRSGAQTWSPEGFLWETDTTRLPELQRRVFMY